MKKYLINAGLLLSVLAVGCNMQTDQKKNVPADGKIHKIAKQYTCAMHPDVISDKPGICSVCGMELVEKEEK